MTTQQQNLPVLSLKNVGIYYKRNRGVFGESFWALKDVSFDLYPGETLGIIGRNGVGKSTLLRLMAGIIKPNKGHFINNGYQISLLSLNLGFIYYLTGRENAILSGMFMGLRKSEIQAKMNAIIEFSELGKFFDQPIATYSSGMLARLGFSVAFQVNPDAEFRQKSTWLMQEKIHSHQTIVFVSHQDALIRQLCHRVVWIEDGVSKAEGHAAHVLKEYHQSLHLS